MPEIAKQDDGFALGGHDGGVFADGEYVLKLWQPGHNGETEVLMRPNSRNGTYHLHRNARGRSNTRFNTVSLPCAPHAHRAPSGEHSGREGSASREAVHFSESGWPDRDGEARQVAFLESAGDHPVMSRFAVKYHGVREVPPPNILNVARAFPIHAGQHKRQSFVSRGREPRSASYAEKKWV